MNETAGRDYAQFGRIRAFLKSLAEWKADCYDKERGGGFRVMLIAGAVVILFIVGLFLEMLSSSPKPDREGHLDTEGEPPSTHPIVDVEAPALRS